MTDKELLSKAARAAGAEVTDYSDRTPDHLTIRHADGIWREWNPLKDDGDALRLAVRLQLDIEFINGDVLVLSVAQGGGDPYADTRRAIVRAAAAIAG